MNQVSATKIVNIPKSTEPVVVEVSVGYGMKCFTIIYIDGKQVMENEKDQFIFELGQCISLKGKLAIIQTMVWDIQKATNNTSVDIEIHCPPVVQKINMAFKVPNDGDVVSYTATIIFV